MGIEPSIGRPHAATIRGLQLISLHCIVLGDDKEGVTNVTVDRIE